MELPVIETTRTCGECTACCTLLGVKAINKQRGIPCPHLRQAPAEAGCGIYETRPQECIDFKCHWLLGHIEPEEFRPDKVGVMITRMHQHYARRDMLTMFEHTEGATMKPEVVRFIGGAIESGEMLLIMFPNKVGLLGPDPAQAQWLLNRMYERAHKDGVDVGKPYSLLGLV